MYYISDKTDMELFRKLVRAWNLVVYNYKIPHHPHIVVHTHYTDSEVENGSTICRIYDVNQYTPNQLLKVNAILNRYANVKKFHNILLDVTNGRPLSKKNMTFLNLLYRDEMEKISKRMAGYGRKNKLFLHVGN